MTQQSTYVTHGEYGVRIQNTNTTTDRGLWRDITGLTAGQTLRVSASCLPSAGTARLIAYDGGGFTNPIVATSSGTVDQVLTVTKVVPAGGSIRVGVFAFSANANTFWDAVLVEPDSGSVGEYRPSLADEREGYPLQTPTSQPNGAILGARWPTPVSVPSPVTVKFRGFTFGHGLGTGVNGFAVVGRTRQHLEYVLPDSLDNAYWTLASDSANRPHDGTNVLRYAPGSDVGWRTTATYAISSPVIAAANRINVLICARVSDPAAVFLAFVLGYDSAATRDLGKAETIRMVNTTPTWYSFDTPLLATYGVPRVAMQARSVNGIGSLDVSALLLVAHTSESTAIVALNNLNMALSVAAGTTNIELGPELTPWRRPNVEIVQENSTRSTLNYSGSPAVYLEGQKLGAALCCTNGTKWRLCDLSNNVINLELQATRTPASLVPE